MKLPSANNVTDYYTILDESDVLSNNHEINIPIHPCV
jgi:hypothetical protein